MAERSVLILQHVPWEEPAAIAAALAAHQVPVNRRIVLDERDPALPQLDQLAGLVVMGGPMGALDAHPGLAAERTLLARATAADIPVLGVCLGMQLLAVALGGTLRPGATREIGFAPITLTDAGARDPLLGSLADGPDPIVLHWHGDIADAPDGAQVLASTPATPVQAFRVGQAVGLQFHLEVTPPVLSRWLSEPAMLADLRPGEREAIAEQGLAVLPELNEHASRGLATFARAVRDRRG